MKNYIIIIKSGTEPDILPGEIGRLEITARDRLGLKHIISSPTQWIKSGVLGEVVNKKRKGIKLLDNAAIEAMENLNPDLTNTQGTTPREKRINWYTGRPEYKDKAARDLEAS